MQNMTALGSIKCSSSGHKGKKYATRFVFIGNRGYGLCDKCFEWLEKVGQIIIKEKNG